MIQSRSNTARRIAVVTVGVIALVLTACENVIPDGGNGEPVPLRVTPERIEIEVGAVVDLSVESSNPEEAFVFESADPDVASVDADGTVRARQQGSTSIAITGSLSRESAEVPIAVTESTIDTTNNPVILSTRRVDDGGVPRVEATLADGRTVILEDLAYMRSIGDRAPDWSTPKPTSNGSSLVGSSRSSSPRAITPPQADRISLTGDQTDIRNQSARGTCVAHAVLAAMEAEYRRQGYGNLDLSEQFAHHIAKMQSLAKRPDNAPPSAAGFENAIALGGGSNPAGMIPLLMLYGVPAEQHHPYIGVTGYEDYTQSGDDPSLVWNDWTSGTYSQELVNSFNTEHNRITINIPRNFTVTPLPFDGLENARYGIAGYRAAEEDEILDPAWYENQLSQRKEIIISTNWITTSDDDTDIIMPRDKRSGEGDAGHAVLIVGYDRRDPDNKYFIVKNSWGPAGSRQFTKLSYDFLNDTMDGHIFAAHVLTGIKDPNRGGFLPTMALGRWNIRYNGIEGRLDIHRKSGFYPAIRDGFGDDYRLGIFYDATGNAYRVNGIIGTGGQVEFYVDFANPERDYEQLTGTKFLGYIDPESPRLMTGTYLDPASGELRSFYASQENLITGETRQTSLVHESFLGSWQIESPILEGTIEIRTVDAANDSFDGRLVDSTGWDAVSGTVDPVTQEVAALLPLESGVTGSFVGYIHGDRRDTIAGVINDAGKKYSVALIRTGGAVTTIEIDSPADRSSFTVLPRGKNVTVSLEATITEDGEIIGDDVNEGNPLVVWTTGAPHQEAGATEIGGRGATTSATFLPGSYTIFAYHDDGVTESVTISVQGDDGPTASISSPADNAFFFDASDSPYVSFTVSGSATDDEDGTIPQKYLQWSYRAEGDTAWTSAGTGSSRTLQLRDVQCSATYYEVRLEATDSDGNVGTSIIRVGVQAWDC